MVVGDLIGVGPSQERAVVGETAHLGVRLQGLAEPNTVVVSGCHISTCARLFRVARSWPISLKGFAEPVQAWRALREGQVASRFEASHARLEWSPLVDRLEEQALLSSCWSRVEAGEGHVVQLSGEPGIAIAAGGGLARKIAESALDNVAPSQFVNRRANLTPRIASSANVTLMVPLP